MIRAATCSLSIIGKRLGSASRVTNAYPTAGRMLSSSSNGGDSGSNSVVKHFVMFEVRPDVPTEDVEKMKQGLLNLWTTITWMQPYELGEDLKLPGGQNHPAGKNRTICWSATFEDVESYERYDQHPDHLACVNDLIKPNIVPGSRAAIQYELKK